MQVFSSSGIIIGIDGLKVNGFAISLTLKHRADSTKIYFLMRKQSLVPALSDGKIIFVSANMVLDYIIIRKRQAGRKIEAAA